MNKQSNLNIPIYRAKKIDRNNYIEGDLISYPDNKFSIRTLSYDCVYDVENIDPSTLAIHFPNMIDKNGKKIFASLSEDGVGGDMKNDIDDIVFIFKDSRLQLRWFFDGEMGAEWDIGMEEIEVIGIHKGDQ